MRQLTARLSNAWQRCKAVLYEIDNVRHRGLRRTMHLPSQVVCLFKPAALQLFAVLLVSTLFQTTLHAQVEGLRATASIELAPSFVGGKPALVGKYQLTCNIQDDRTKYGFGEMKLFYSITLGDPKGDADVRGLSGLYADGGLGNSVREGPLEVTGPLGGSRVRGRLSGAYCHHDQLNSELLTVWTADIVIPPQISVIAAFDPDHPNDPQSVSFPGIPITKVPDVPVGKKLVIMLDINAHPRGTESVVLFYRNAGVNFTQVLYDVAKDYDPMKEVVIPTVVGDVNLKVWAEFRPTQTRSNVLEFHVVGDPDKPKVVSKIRINRR